MHIPCKGIRKDTLAALCLTMSDDTGALNGWHKDRSVKCSIINTFSYAWLHSTHHGLVQDSYPLASLTEDREWDVSCQPISHNKKEQRQQHQLHCTLFAPTNFNNKPAAGSSAVKIQQSATTTAQLPHHQCGVSPRPHSALSQYPKYEQSIPSQTASITCAQEYSCHTS